ncbi:uncharacterized protein LOC117789548 [Drosophila innubila]|uniref:uncharacterized protein LOC117789548 n=1 Tax=Drosophila innubila TaxID=198719 RepID=UPI00148DF597|nr:uncharacterized protein LOC117789548 [Drosophila innubila]
MTNAVCESKNKSWVTFESCRLHALQRNKTILNLFATFLQPTNSITLRLQVQKRANGFKPWVIDINFDVCQFLKSKKNKVAKVVYDLFKDFSNINHSCPFMGKQVISGFYPTVDKLPHVMPTGDYVLLMTWKFYEKIQFVTNVYFTFIEDF